MHADHVQCLPVAPGFIEWSKLSHGMWWWSIHADHALCLLDTFVLIVCSGEISFSFISGLFVYSILQDVGVQLLCLTSCLISPCAFVRSMLPTDFALQWLLTNCCSWFVVLFSYTCCILWSSWLTH
ncbi:hypothetical protein BKA83DRAFT_1193923 [Pisolithus microcarpus]|nr:hypothetical protein BKA83DRAFT_1193923 [Pisolithus microcarpus]